MKKIEMLPPTEKEFKEICSLANLYKLDCENLELNQFIIAKINKQTVGFVRLKEYPECVELSTLGILTEYRSKGIGQYLIYELSKMTQADKIYIVTVIPTYFTKSGFKQTFDIPKSLKSKKESCKIKCNCTNTTVMILTIDN